MSKNSESWTHTFNFEGHNYTLFKRNQNRDGAWCCDFIVDGKRIKRSLKTNNAAAAEELVKKEYIKPAKQERWTEIDHKKAKRDFATLGQVIEKYTLFSTGVIGNGMRNTARDNVNAMRAVVRRGLGHNEWTAEKVDALSTSVLTGKLVRDFQTWMIQDGVAKGANPESRKRSIDSYMGMARSLFAERSSLLESYKDAKLKLPELSEFMKQKTHRAARLNPKPADEQLLERTFKAATVLREQDRPAYIAWLLSGCSLRRSEVGRMKHSWLELRKGRWVIVTDSLVKSKCARTIPIDQRIKTELDLYKEIATVEGDYILPCPPQGNGGPNAKRRADRIMRRVDKWMRSLGWETRHTMHEMRSYYLQRMTAQEGMEAAQSAAGHADMETTQWNYVGKKDVSNVIIQLPMLDLIAKAQ